MLSKTIPNIKPKIVLLGVLFGYETCLPQSEEGKQVKNTW
jgi:hypothetical protein